MGSTEIEIGQWLTTFAKHVRNVDYASAKQMFNPNCYCFGSVAERLTSLNELIEKQWKEIWPNIEDFRFDLHHLDCKGSKSDDIATAICPWHSTGFHEDGTSYPRSGRVTIIFRKNADTNTWLAYHTHFSLNPGIPQYTIKKTQAKLHP